METARLMSIILVFSFCLVFLAGLVIGGVTIGQKELDSGIFIGQERIMNQIVYVDNDSCKMVSTIRGLVTETESGPWKLTVDCQ